MAAPGAGQGLILDIRKAVATDAASIARVNVDAWRTTYRALVSDPHLAALSYDARERVWSRVIEDPKQILVVADEAGDVVGFANGGPNRGDETRYRGELYAIYLLQAHQGRGAGRRLTRAIEEHAGPSMIVWVLRDNPACGFYRKLGGVPAGSRSVVIGDRTLEEVAFGWTGPLS